MKAFAYIVVSAALTAGLAACATSASHSRSLVVKAVVIEAPVTETSDFTNRGYADLRFLVRVVEPAEMLHEVLAISLWNGWGAEVRSYGDPKDWQVTDGEIVIFEVKQKDLAKRWPSAPRSVNADRVKRMKAAEPGATDNPGGAQ